MIVWTHSVLGVLHACVLCFRMCSCSEQLSMFHVERRSRNTIIVIITFIINIESSLLDDENWDYNYDKKTLLKDRHGSSVCGRQ